MATSKDPNWLPPDSLFSYVSIILANVLTPANAKIIIANIIMSYDTSLYQSLETIYFNSSQAMIVSKKFIINPSLSDLEVAVTDCYSSNEVNPMFQEYYLLKEYQSLSATVVAFEAY